MASTTVWKVYDPSGSFIAACKHVEDAAAILSLRGAGATIRYKHGRVLWREGAEDIEAAESYDHVTEVVHQRLRGGQPLMKITELRTQARTLRDQIQAAQDDHPRVGVLNELMSVADGLDYNLSKIEALISDGLGHDGIAMNELLIRTGWCLGKLHTLARFGEASWTTKTLRSLRPPAQVWAITAQELVNLLPSVELDPSCEVCGLTDETVGERFPDCDPECDMQLCKPCHLAAREEE